MWIAWFKFCALRKAWTHWGVWNQDWFCGHRVQSLREETVLSSTPHTGQWRVAVAISKNSWGEDGLRLELEFML